MHSSVGGTISAATAFYAGGMIIEAGYDLVELFAPKILVRRVRKRHQGIWVLALDEDLRNLYMDEVGGDPSLPVEDRIPDIVESLAKDQLRPVAYYALAQLDTGLRGDYSQAFRHLDETLEMAPELINHESLGTFVSNGKDFYFTGPRYSYRDYVGYEHLPRTAILPGPHSYDCACLACTQFEEKLQRNWERHQAAVAED